MKKKIYFFLVLLTIIFSMLSFNACGSKKEASRSGNQIAQDYSQMNVEADIASGQNSKMKQESKAATTPENIDASKLSQRKLIQRGYLDIQTKEFEKSIAALNEKVKVLGGYIENSTISGNRVENINNSQMRHANFSLRIPTKHFNSFMDGSSVIGNVVTTTISGEDVTSQYFDTEARLKSLKLQEERLLELLKKSGTLKDVLEIEKELVTVRYEIENLTGTLKRLDNLIDYSTVDVNLQEVDVLSLGNSGSDLGEKIKYKFINSINNVIQILKISIIGVIAFIPYLIIIIPIVLIMRYLFKRSTKKFSIKNLFKKNKNDK
ncbi:DUF4349 domain-containing protein [Clostridium sp. HMP27]|uniref:DUF4349 domain-containing protein n=1 Tax=Clostridium sp. HMP27 TaxID=1487921 RepID=UPI00052CF7CD|nr:DUF4349 domain-containing protein [Clostridium sp. HMP27]KGK87016.1 hypothetical protein DP68_12500 [Clostridium sp. HMP27]